MLKQMPQMMDYRLYFRTGISSLFADWFPKPDASFSSTLDFSIFLGILVAGVSTSLYQKL